MPQLSLALKKHHYCFYQKRRIVRIIAQSRTKNCQRSPNLAKSKKKNLPWSDCVQKKSVRYYVGQVINVFEDDDVIFRFLKRSYHSALVSGRPAFIFPEDTNDASEFTHNLEDIVFKLPVPLKKGGTKRCRQKLQPSIVNFLFFGEQHDYRTKIGLCLRISHRVLSATHKILHALPINYP